MALTPVLSSEDALKQVTSTPVPAPGSLNPEQALQYAASSTKSDLPVSTSNINREHLNDYSSNIIDTGDPSKYDAGYVDNEPLEDYRYNNQSAAAQIGLGVTRTIGGAILNLGEAASVLASGAGGLAANAVSAINNEFTSDPDKKTGYYRVDDMVNNPLDNFFYGIEDSMKDQFHIYKPSDWDSKSIGSQMGSTAWWADDGASVAAFALSNLIPAGAIADLGLGAKVAGTAARIAEGLGDAADVAVAAGEDVGKTAGLGKYANQILMGKAGYIDAAGQSIPPTPGILNPISIAKNTDALAQNAYMTTSEAFFMARDAGKAVTQNYLQSKGLTDETQLNTQQQAELAAAKSTSENYTFWSNMVALTGVSHVEAGFVNKFFGHASTEDVGHLINLGEGIEDNATSSATTGVQKFLNSTYGSIVKNVPKYVFTEGALKANIQNAIQATTTQFGFLGKGNYLGQVASTAINQLTSADAWKGMMANVVVGGIMGVAGGIKEQAEQNKAVGRAITSINSAKENFVNLQNVMYQRDDTGNIKTDPTTNKPIYDVPSILNYVANVSQVQDLGAIHDQLKLYGDDKVAPIVRNELFTKYALAHLEAGLGDEFIAKTKSLSSYKDEDLAKMGFDPIQLDDNGNKISIAQRTQDLLTQATQIQKDYNQASKTIGYVKYFNTGNKVNDGISNADLQNSRTNEAVKLQSRMRSLDSLVQDSNRQVQDLQAKQLTGGSGGDGIVESINSQSRQLSAQVEAYNHSLELGNINPDSRIATQLKNQIKDQEQAIIDAKKTAQPDLEKLGYTVTPDASELTDETPESPDVTEIKEHLQDIEDAKVAKLGLQDRYNKIADYNNGAKNFVGDIAAKTKDDIDVANKTADENDTTDKSLSQFQEGDNVAYGNNRGIVQKDANNNLHINGEPLTKGFLNRNPDLRKQSQSERDAEYNTSIKARDTERLKTGIQRASDRLDTITKGEDQTKSAILEHIIKPEELIIDESKGKFRISPYDITHQIDNVQSSLHALELENRELQDQEQKITGGKPDNISPQLPEVEQALQESEETISSLYKLQSSLESLRSELFSNGENNDGRARQEFTDKDSLQKLKEVSDALLQVKNLVDDKVNNLNDTIKNNQLELNKLLKAENDKPEDEDVNNPPTVGWSAQPAIDKTNGLNKTAGNQRTKDRNENKNEKLSQKVWYKFAQDFDPKNLDRYYFRAVTINDHIYGVGKEQDIYQEEDKKYQHIDNIKVLVVDKTGKPIYQHGSRVYTSLPEITKDKTEPEHFKNFRYTDKLLARKSIEDYRDLTDQIKNSKKVMNLQITGKSNGIMVEGEPISAKDAFGKQLPLTISLATELRPLTTIGGGDYPLPAGLVYANYNGTPVGAEQRTLTPQESQAVLSKLKEYAKLRGNSDAVNNGQILNQIKGTILLNSRAAGENLSIYFIKGKNKLAFGDKVISTKDLIDGKYDDQLKEFLDNQNLQTDFGLLDKNKPFTDIFDKKWSSYQDYLLSPREDLTDTPLLFKIAPKTDELDKPQFINTYLTFSKPKNSVKETASQKTSTKSQAVAFDSATTLPFALDVSNRISMADMAKGIKNQIEPTQEVKNLIENEGNPNPTRETSTNEQGTTGSGIENSPADRGTNQETNQGEIQTDLLDDWYLHQDQVKDYKPIDFDKEQDWFRKNISTSLPFDKVKGLIDKGAYGKFTKAGQTLISYVATEGTGYHEAFHVVSQLYLTDKEREGLYTQWKTNNKADVSDKEAEEGLAEEFREYILTKQSPYKSFFDKIVSFIKGLVGIGNEDRNTLFSRISNGYFLDSRIKSSSDLDLYKMSDHLDASTTKDLLDSMTLALTRGLFQNGFTLKDIDRFNEYGKGNGTISDEDADRFTNLYKSVVASVVHRITEASKIQPNGEHLENVARYISENKGSVQEDHMTHMNKYGIQLKTEDEEGLPEDFERSKDTLGILSSVEFSAKSGMPNVIQLMIAALPERYVDENGITRTKLNNLGLPQISNYRRNVAVLTNELANISDFKDQMAKVNELSSRIPELSLLADQLGVTANSITPISLSTDYFDLQSKFRQQFDKAYLNFYNQIYGSTTDDEGNKTNDRRIYLLDSNTDKVNKIISARWEGQAYQETKPFKIVNGQKILDKDYFNKTYSKALKDDEKTKSVLSFYKDLGITFTNPEGVDINGLASFQNFIIKRINDKEISSVFDKDAQLSKSINYAIAQEANQSLDYADNQHISPDGKTNYNVSLHSYITSLAAKINSKGLPQELLWDETTQTGNPLARHSAWIDKIKSKKLISIGIQEGAKIDSPGETGTSTSKLSTPNAAGQQFSAILGGHSVYMRAGDKALEFSIAFSDKKGTIETPEFTDLNERTKYFQGVLSDELVRSYMLNVQGVGAEYEEYAATAKDLTIFKGIFNKAEEEEYTKLIGNKAINRAEAIILADKFVQEDAPTKALQDWFDRYAEDNKEVLKENNLVKEAGGIYSLLGISPELADKFVGKEDALSEIQMKSLVEQFTYNQLQGNIEQTKLLTGDLAFYNQFFKRTSGLTGTGKVMWVGADADNWLNANSLREYQSYDGTIKIDKKSDSKIQTLVFNDVKAVSSRFEEYIGNLVDRGMDKDFANEILAGYNKAYDEGDAQGYMSLPEYREMHQRAGIWSDSQEFLYPKLIRGEELKKQDIEKFLNAFGARKPQAFGSQTDPNGLFVPTFYKFSVFPLIPSVIKETELEELMHTMLATGHGISLFKSGNKVGSKAGNDLYDQDGKINLDAENLITQEIPYSNLKIQLDIDPSMKSKVIIGTQERKIVLANQANKTLTINGKQIDGNKVIDEYSRLVSIATELEMNDLKNRLGIKQVGENYSIPDTSKFLNILSTEAFNRQAPDNLLEGLKQVLPKDAAHKQFDILVNRNKIENILMSLVNNSVIKQKTFGDARVQASSVGFESKAGLKGRSIADAEKATWWSKVENLDGSENKSLSFYKTNPNGTEPMEIYLPHYFKELIGENLNVNNIQDKLLKVLGYRIPTSAQNMIELTKIKGFLPQEAGNLIVVPSEIVVKAGSDFDIDKLNLHFPNYEMVDGKPQYLEYDSKNEEHNNSIPRIHNRINDLAWKILAAPENFEQLITPNSTGDVENIAKEIQKIKEKQPSPTDNGKGNNIGWRKNLETREAFMGGKEGIGIAAIQNTNHILNQLNNTLADPNIKINLEHNEKDGKVDFSQDREKGAHAVNSYRISYNIAAFLNGLVDAAKNPFLSTINATVDTLPTYLYLLKAGVPLRQLIMFMNQPILTEYLKQTAADDSLGLKAAGLKLGDDKLISKVYDLFPVKQAKLDLSNPTELENYKKTITTDKLESYIKGNQNNPVQRQILLDYLNYKDQADGMSDLIKATSPDTRGTGATMNSAQNVLDNYEKLKQNSIFENVEGYMKTFIGAFHNAVDDSTKMYKNFFYTEETNLKNEVGRIKELAQLNKRISADNLEKVLNLAKNDLINYTMQSTPINGNMIKNFVKEVFTGDNSVAKVVARLKDEPLLKDNPIIKELVPLVSSNTTREISNSKALDNLKIFSKRLDAVDSNLLTEGWKELFNANEQFATNLMTFTIMQSGLNNSPVSFTQYAPNEYYVQLVSQLLSNKDVPLDGFYDKFIRNNYQNNDLVPTIRKFITGTNGSTTIADGKTANVRSPQRSKITGRLLGQDNTKYDYVKAWDSKTQSYELYRNTNIDGARGRIFERVSKLGDGYNLKEWTDESAVLSNRIDNTIANPSTRDDTNELQDLKENFKDANNKPIC